jgi:hypothetical protein
MFASVSNIDGRGGKRGGSWEETSQKVFWLPESFQQLKDVLI